MSDRDPLRDMERRLDAMAARPREGVTIVRQGWHG